jgi:hypothetical protein
VPDNERVYLHEFVDIIGQQRARYMHHMTAYWCPENREKRAQLLFGVWGILGSTGQWPQVVNLWEYPGGWDGLGASFDLETSNPVMQDPFLQEWWAAAAPLRRGGFDRLLVPAPWTRAIDELVADGVRGAAYAHELVTVPPGQSLAVLDQVADVGRACVESTGAELIGAFNVALRNDTECILLWAFPDWRTWSSFERSWSANGPLSPWRKTLVDAGADVTRILLIDSPLNPMKIGRQPTKDDRRPLEDFYPPLERP